VLVHEVDPENGGCPFARFFQTTPEDLIVDGLYKTIAVAFPPYPHRGASYALLARALGAVKISKAMRTGGSEEERDRSGYSSVEGSRSTTYDKSASRMSKSIQGNGEKSKRKFDGMRRSSVGRGSTERSGAPVASDFGAIAEDEEMAIGLPPTSPGRRRTSSMSRISANIFPGRRRNKSKDTRAPTETMGATLQSCSVIEGDQRVLPPLRGCDIGPGENAVAEESSSAAFARVSCKV